MAEARRTAPVRNRLHALLDEKPSALGTFITLGDPTTVELEAAQRWVEEQPKPGAEAIFEHVYEGLSPRLAQQRADAVDDAT